MKPLFLRKLSLLILVVAIGLWGCAFTQIVAPPGQPPAASSPGTAAPPELLAQTTSPANLAPPPATVTPSAALPAPATSTFTPTSLPTYTRAPSLTPFPSITPLPTLLLPTIQVLASPTFNPRGTNYPYTLRVFNRGKRAYWIGTHPPTLGNCIKPDKYIEFYLTAPQAINVYWCVLNCGAISQDRQILCENRLVSVSKPLTVVEVPILP